MAGFRVTVQALAALIWKKMFEENPLHAAAGQRQVQPPAAARWCLWVSATDNWRVGRLREALLQLGGGRSPWHMLEDLLGSRPTMAQLVEVLVQEAEHWRQP
jgi:hypothetical protein